MVKTYSKEVQPNKAGEKWLSSNLNPEGDKDFICWITNWIETEIEV